MSGKVYRKDWRELRIAVVDTETTGVNTEKDRVTEIGILTFENLKPVERYCKLINPEIPISKGAQNVSGITDEMVSPKRPFRKRVDEIKAILNKADVLCMYNEAFDRDLLIHEFARCDDEFPDDLCVIDPRIFSDFLVPSGPNTLDAVAQRMRAYASPELLNELRMKSDRHRADYDALITGIVLERYSQTLPKTLRQLLYVQDWMYRYWLLYVRQNNQKYARKLEPTLPPCDFE